MPELNSNLETPSVLGSRDHGRRQLSYAGAVWRRGTSWIEAVMRLNSRSWDPRLTKGTGGDPPHNWELSGPTVCPEPTANRQSETEPTFACPGYS